jgi:hypothetical protein
MSPDGYIGPVTEVTVANDGIWLPNDRDAATARGEGPRTQWHPRKSYLRWHQRRIENGGSSGIAFRAREISATVGAFLMGIIVQDGSSVEMWRPYNKGAFVE